MMFALTRYNDALDEYGERLPSDFRVLFKNALKRVLEESIYGRMNQQMIYNACMKMYEVKPDNRSDALTILPTPLKTMLERRAKWHSMKYKDVPPSLYPEICAELLSMMGKESGGALTLAQIKDRLKLKFNITYIPRK